MEINYLDYLKKINGLSVEEINVDEILKKDINYDLEMLTVTMIQNDLIELEGLLDSLESSVALYMEKSITYFNIIKQYTILKINNGEDIIDNYSIILEEALLKNPFIRRCYQSTKELNFRRKMSAIDTLNEALENIPNTEEMKNISEDFEKMFSKENKDNLKILENIVAFNDPSMKALKDVVYDASTDVLIKPDDINNKKRK